MLEWRRVQAIARGIGGLLIPDGPARTRKSLLNSLSPELPPEAEGTHLTGETLKRAQAMYLYPDRFDRRMMVGALDALERRFDAVRFTDHGDKGLLMVGPSVSEVPIDNQVSIDRFRTTLGSALHFVANLEEELRRSSTWK